MAAALLGASEKGTLKDGKATEVSAVVTETRFTQLYREYLEKQQLLDKRHRVKKLPGGTVALPVVEETFIEQHLQELKMHVAPESTCVLARIQNPLLSKRAQLRSPAQKLRSAVRCLVEGRGVPWSAGLERDLPRAWQRHGDLLLVSEDSFRAPLWEELGQELWETVAAALGVRRLAKRGRVAPGGTRTPRVTLLLGDDGWVEHVDDGIRYTFDVTQCMFCPGNVTEKLRVASLPCAGEVLVDLYAGIGYFTLPFLVHAGVAFVHACEWNPHAVAALRRNLELNGVADRCQIHAGDNRKLDLEDRADRVNLGLIPSCQEGWPVACRVLRRDRGGVLHIHHNVEAFPDPGPRVKGPPQPPRGSPSGGEEPRSAADCGRGTPVTVAPKVEWRRWAESAEAQIGILLEQLHGKPWRTRILHIEPVKSYAPHVDHVVLDLECRPLPS
ncbi:tRNA wybutosine-synthesizing protein 2 homolog isoform X1 [Ornithorhynchus anatinus]|uniref:tRNA wybutosine-synthesizing protein 2 homolog n=1 Tax=Ornithorhynchus anatinus TaxID=9258 RepID=F6ZRD9_ORNAN|nr:tRNA wybutosine-synthesizing protein 2 homolog isoform X1 [Ornithorhynchus anatinus]